MKKIEVVEAPQDNVFNQLYSLYETFKQIKSGEDIIFDFKKIKRINTLLIAAVSHYIRSTKSEFLPPENKAIAEYLEKICFPRGIDSADKLEEVKKTYLPISYVVKSADPTEKSKIQYSLLEIIYRLVGGMPGAKDALIYPVYELVENIFEHSKKDFGCLFGRILEKEEYLEICIIDSGRGLRRSYEEESHLELDDETAVAYSLTGKSTKNYERGFGVRTSKNVVCQGLNGDFMLISGQAAYAVSDNEDFAPLLPRFNWQGVIIFYRIPFPKKAIDMRLYYE